MPLPINGLWRFVIERMVVPPGDVELEVSAQARDGLSHLLVVVQVNLLVFDRTPQLLNEDVVQCSTPSIRVQFRPDVPSCGITHNFAPEAVPLI